MQKLKRILTCSSATTSPSSPPAHRDAEESSDRMQGPAASADTRFDALAEKPIRPYMEGVLEHDLPSPERQLRRRINTELLPRTNELVEVCKQLENGNALEYVVALHLQKQLDMRRGGLLIGEYGEQIGGGDELDDTVRQLEKDVERYLASNPGTPPLILRPRLSIADGRVHVDSPFFSPRPSVPPFVPTTALVTRPGSDAGIADDVMAAALSLVKVDSQTSSAMENEENLLNTRVGNFLQAISKDQDVNMMVVITAKHNKDKAADLVDALKRLLKPLPNLK